MEQIKIKKIYKNDSRKDGTEYKDKNGKPFRIITIVFDLNGKETKASCIEYADKPLNLIEHEVHSVTLEQNGDFLNFRLPSKADMQDERITRLEEELDKLTQVVAKMSEYIKAKFQ